MASAKALIGISAGIIGLSLLAGGPVGASLAATFFTGLVIAALVTSLALLSPRMHFGPSFGWFNRPWFGGLHTRSFVPAPHLGGTTHTRHFNPAPSYTPGFGASLASGLRSFGGGTTVHTGHYFRPR